MPRPQILFLAHRVPYPPNRGDRIRSFHLLQFLARRADVHLAYLTDSAVPDDTQQALTRLCKRVLQVHLHPQRRWINSALSLARGRSATEGLFHSKDLKRQLVSWAHQTQFDAAFVFCSSMAQYLRTEGLQSISAVLDLVDVDSQKWFDYADKRSGLMRWLLRLEGARLRKVEQSLPDLVDAITVVTEQEADLFQTFRSDYRPHVLRNGVDLTYFKPTLRTETPSNRTDATPVQSVVLPLSVVFVGALDYQANVDGVAWFCTHVWPEVRKRFGNATFRIVGSRPNAKAIALGELPGVELIGEVNDVRPWLHRATVVVAPLLVARGVQNKVLEALATGKPLVVSPQALEGIDAQPEVHLLLAQTPSQWIDQLTKLFESVNLCERLGKAGRSFVERECLWSTQLEKLCRLPGLKGFLQASESVEEPLACAMRS